MTTEIIPPDTPLSYEIGSDSGQLIAGSTATYNDPKVSIGGNVVAINGNEVKIEYIKE